MTTTVTVIVRQDDPTFHGAIAQFSVEGDGREVQYELAILGAMAAAGVKNTPGWLAPVVEVPPLASH